MLDVTTVRHVHDHVLWIHFSDGTEGLVDLSAELDGEIFEPLRSVAYFARVVVDAEIGTIAWPNGADFAPEFLHRLLRTHAQA